MNECSFDGCEKPRYAYGLCHSHNRQRRDGVPLTPLRRHVRDLADRFLLYTEARGDCLIWIGPLNATGYGVTRRDGKMRLAHRVAYELAYGPVPAGQVVDHRCHTPACVRSVHLQAVTQKQNQENRSGPTARSKSGVRGVFWHKASGKWCAVVKHHGRAHRLSLFADLSEADTAVRAKRLELFTNNLTDRTERSA